LNPGRLFKWEEIDRLAASLSFEFGTSLSVHYDDRGGVKAACLFRHGTAMREFGEADEVWVPMDEDWKPLAGDTRRPWERTAGVTGIPPHEGDEVRRDGWRGFGASNSTVEAGEPTLGTPWREGDAGP
jgi:hypothetical protein